MTLAAAIRARVPLGQCSHLHTRGQTVDCRTRCPGDYPSWCRNCLLLEAAERLEQSGAPVGVDTWKRTAYFAAKARNMRALRGRFRAGDSAQELATGYDLPPSWVERVCQPGYDLLSGTDDEPSTGSPLCALAQQLRAEAVIAEELGLSLDVERARIKRECAERIEQTLTACLSPSERGQ